MAQAVRRSSSFATTPPKTQPLPPKNLSAKEEDVVNLHVDLLLRCAGIKENVSAGSGQTTKVAAPLQSGDVSAFFSSYRAFMSEAQMIFALDRIYQTASSKNIKKLNTFVFNWVDKCHSEMSRRGKAATLRFLEGRLSKPKFMQVQVALIREVRDSYPVPDKQTVQTRWFLGQKAQVLAHHLTAIEWSLFKRIRPTEFARLAWSKETRNQSAPHLTKMAARFNVMSQWTATLILTAPKSMGWKVLEKFMRIVEVCAANNNYTTTAQILAGINMISVQRLKDLLWQHISEPVLESFNAFDVLMSPSNNYQAYRQHFAQILKKHKGKKTALLPCLAVVLKDLTAIEEGNPDTITQAHASNPAARAINLEKIKLLGTHVAMIKNLQSFRFSSAELDDSLLVALDNLQVMTDEQLYQLSLRLKPFKGANASPTPSSSTNECVSDNTPSDDSEKSTLPTTSIPATAAPADPGPDAVGRLLRGSVPTQGPPGSRRSNGLNGSTSGDY